MLWTSLFYRCWFLFFAVCYTSLLSLALHSSGLLLSFLVVVCCYVFCLCLFVDVAVCSCCLLFVIVVGFLLRRIAVRWCLPVVR